MLAHYWNKNLEFIPEAEEQVQAVCFLCKDPVLATQCIMVPQTYLNACKVQDP